MQSSTLDARYIKAGGEIMMNMRIGVSGSCALPHSEVCVNDDHRQVYRAKKSSALGKQVTVSRTFALLLVVLTTIIMFTQFMERVNEGHSLESAILDTQEEYMRVGRELQTLNADFDKARDSSYICYYAAQKLGMKRAVDESIIKISASDTRPVLLDGMYVTKSAGI
jgi:hypothetical protein